MSCPTTKIDFTNFKKLFDKISVARVQPRTSKGITDLLLPQTSNLLTAKIKIKIVPLRSKKFSSP